MPPTNPCFECEGPSVVLASASSVCANRWFIRTPFFCRAGFGGTARALAFDFVIQSRTLPGDESVPTCVLPNLLPDAPHLKNRIIVITRSARLARVLVLIPIEERVILLWQFVVLWRQLALPVRVKIITLTKKPVGAGSNLIEHPVPGGIRTEVGHIVKIDVRLQTRPRLRVCLLPLCRFHNFGSREGFPRGMPAMK